MARAAATTTEPLPWWAAPGDELCTSCLQRYHYHLEVRCTACDLPLCPSCATHLTLDVVELHCADCATAPTSAAEEP